MCEVTDFELTFSQCIDDSSFKNCQWSRVTQIFTPREVGNAEMALLHALEWNISITEGEAMRFWTALVRPTVG
jgi:hypothetical protein